MNWISGSPSLLRNIDVGEILRLREEIARLEGIIRELEQKKKMNHPRIMFYRMAMLFTLFLVGGCKAAGWAFTMLVLGTPMSPGQQILIGFAVLLSVTAAIAMALVIAHQPLE